MRSVSISQISTIAALVSIATSLWAGLALLMGVRGANQLPPSASRTLRLSLGVLTFLLWYVGMLSAVGLLALMMGRKLREIGFTVLGLFAATGGLWGLRRLVRAAWVPAAPS